MPRNSSGTMTRAKGPYVSGTTISSSDVNSELADIATELTDSASRSGKGGFTAPVRGADGTAAAPTHSWTNDTDSGLYSKGANNPAMSAGNGERQEWTSAGSKITGTLEVTGASTLTGNVQVGGTLDVNGATLSLGAATVTDDGAGNLGFGAKKLTGVADPGAAQDVATKNYVDAISWTAATLGANWAGTVEYMQRHGFVYLRGSATFTTGATVLFTLPAGMRPAAVRRFNLPERDGVAAAASKVFQVPTNGSIQVDSPGTALTNGKTYHFDGVFFEGEQ